MPLPDDYLDRVYAGVLGKIIAVYLGRPVEGWTYERIMAELGEITYYVNGRDVDGVRDHPLVVTDDDITGTLIFPRALADRGPVQLDAVDSTVVGRTWLNYIVPFRTVLWWGGLGNSTEHTAYLRMRDGIAPPRSGSAELNGTVVADQVGAQIFVEGFAMTCPGDPAAAADLAERAARVSHDGDAVQGARMIAALVAGAFTCTDMDELLDLGVAQVDPSSLIRRVIDDVRGWAADGDWHATRRRIGERYGYDRYGGNCHIVPNHAVVIAALAHSRGDFDEAMKIVVTSGWDTDSNGGDVGSITGVFGGLAGLERQDWRGPVADRLYLPTADGGEAITDAVRETYRLFQHGFARSSGAAGVVSAGPRFHFALPGSVQGFAADPDTGSVGNDAGALLLTRRGSSMITTTPTFIPPDALDLPGYRLEASPTLYPGQRITARVAIPAAEPAARVSLLIRHYGGDDTLIDVLGPAEQVAPGQELELSWIAPDTGGQPIAAVGLRFAGDDDHDANAALRVIMLSWNGTPALRITRPDGDAGRAWHRAFVDAVDHWSPGWAEPFRIVQDVGTGMVMTGTRDWRDYVVSADVTVHLAEAAGLAARVQGMNRHYLLELVGRDRARLTRRCHTERVLGEIDFAWEYGRAYRLELQVSGRSVRAMVDDVVVADLVDDGCLTGGGVALSVTEGRAATEELVVQPVTPSRAR